MFAANGIRKEIVLIFSSKCCTQYKYSYAIRRNNENNELISCQ